MKVPLRGLYRMAAVKWTKAVKQELQKDPSPRYISVSLPEPMHQDEQSFSYMVLPMKMTPKLELAQFGSGFLCQTDSEAKEVTVQLSETLKENLSSVRTAGWEDVRFVTHQVETKCEIITGFNDFNKICFIRHKWSRSPSTSDLSKDHHFGIAHIPSVGISGVATIKEMREGQLIELKHFAVPKKLRNPRCKFSYEAFIYCGEKCKTNLEETICFVATPKCIASRTNIDETCAALVKFVLALLQEEQRKDRLLTETLEQERLKLKPSRLPHEASEMDHYANQQQVVEKLLRKEWRLLFEAMNKAKQMKTEIEIADSRKQIWLAYIADHKSLFGKIPDVRQDEAFEILKDDDFHSLLNKAMNAPLTRVDKRDWQLATGWIVKNYYRMDEDELEQAFAQDWNYPIHQHKGNTLAKRARRIGLSSALKRGRPEKPNSLPPG